MTAKGKRKTRKRPLVFDSWAVIAFLEDEPAADNVEKILVEAIQTKVPLLITTVNLGEIWYSVARNRTDDDGDAAHEQLLRMGFEIVDADWQITRQAAVFKSKYKLAYANCFAAALAKTRETQVVTGDQEFSQLDREIKITWV